jgi:hypothetical protein
VAPNRNLVGCADFLGNRRSFEHEFSRIFRSDPQVATRKNGPPLLQARTAVAYHLGAI